MGLDCGCESRMNNIGFPGLMCEYNPNGRRNIGVARKRWKDQHLWSQKPGMVCTYLLHQLYILIHTSGKICFVHSWKICGKRQRVAERDWRKWRSHSYRCHHISTLIFTTWIWKLKSICSGQILTLGLMLYVLKEYDASSARPNTCSS